MLWRGKIFSRQITTVSSIWQIKVPHKSKALIVFPKREGFLLDLPLFDNFFEGALRARRKSIYAPDVDLRRSFPVKWDRSDITDVMSTPQVKANASTNWKKKRLFVIQALNSMDFESNRSYFRFFNLHLVIWQEKSWVISFPANEIFLWTVWLNLANQKLFLLWLFPQILCQITTYPQFINLMWKSWRSIRKLMPLIQLLKMC